MRDFDDRAQCEEFDKNWERLTGAVIMRRGDGAVPDDFLTLSRAGVRAVIVHPDDWASLMITTPFNEPFVTLFDVEVFDGARIIQGCRRLAK